MQTFYNAAEASFPGKSNLPDVPLTFIILIFLHFHLTFRSKDEMRNKPVPQLKLFGKEEKYAIHIHPNRCHERRKRTARQTHE